MHRPATLVKVVASAAAILILAAGCTQSPTNPSPDLGVYANGEGR